MNKYEKYIENGKFNLKGLNENELDNLVKEYKLKTEFSKEYKYSLKRKGTILKTDPSLFDAKTKKEVRLEISKFNVLFLLLLLIPTILYFLYSLPITEPLRANIRSIFGISRPTAPYIDGGSNEWAKERTIKVVREAHGLNDISHYEYCMIEDRNTSKCDWKTADGLQQVIGKTGIWNIYFRAVDIQNNKGDISNREHVRIDNESPKIKSIEISNISATKAEVNVTAEDLHSGVDHYVFIINGQEIESKDGKATIEKLSRNSKYNLTIVVYDKLLNSTVVSRVIETNDREDQNEDNIFNEFGKPTYTVEPNENKWTSYKTVTINYPRAEGLTREYSLDHGKTWHRYTGAIVFYENGFIQARVSDGKKTLTADEKEIKFIDSFVPEISLEDVPTIFEYQENYKLPSSYKFGESGGNVVCTVDGIEKENTSDVKIGNHEIVCTATSNAGISTTVRKNIKVDYKKAEDKSWDGWIRINLNYPEGSYDREWRLVTDDVMVADTNTGYLKNYEWQEYTGPIVIRPEDTNHVYIRYKLDDKNQVETYNGDFGVAITPSKLTASIDKKAKIKIDYIGEADLKLYRVNGGEWHEYHNPFEVGPNTQVDAKYVKYIDTYDANGNLVTRRHTIKTDSVFIGLDTDAPVNPFVKGGTGIDEEGYANYFVRVTINPETRNVGYGEKTKVTLTATEGAFNVEYRINDGKWIPYDKPFEVGAISEIEAHAYKLYDGRIVEGTSSAEIDYTSEARAWLATRRYIYIALEKDSLKEGEFTHATVKYPYQMNNIMYKIGDDIWRKYTGKVKLVPGDIIEVKGVDEFGYEHHDMKQVHKIVENNESNLYWKISLSSPTYVTGYATAMSNNVTNVEYKLNNADWTKYVETLDIKEGDLIELKGLVKGTTSKYLTDVYYFNKNDREVIEYYEALNTYRPSPANINIENPVLIPGQTTKVTMEFSDVAAEKYYRVNQGEWIKFTGEELTVPTCTTIETMSVFKKGTSKDGLEPTKYDITLYSSNGTHLPEGTGGGGGGSGSSSRYYKIPSPSIKESASEDPNKAVITIEGPENALEIYYSVNEGEYIEYNDSFEVDRGSKITAYFITSGLEKSPVAVYEVEPNMDDISNGPALYIDAENHLDAYIPHYIVSLVANGYNTLEYSFDGVVYKDYTEPLMITDNTKIYAKAVGDTGVTYKTLVINDILNGTPAISESSDNIIIGTTNEEVASKINRTRVVITYDSRSANKLYKIGLDGAWTKYTGPFYVDKNCTIYAYSYGNIESAYATKQIDWFDDGIVDPIIEVEPENEISSSVTVTINYDKNAVYKRYRIDNGGYKDYTGPFTLNKNSTITAISANSDNVISYAYKTVSNISELKPIVEDLSDGDKIIFIKLNYPSTAILNSREYQVNDNEWALYPDEGIALVKREYADELININDELWYSNKAGRKVKFEGHHYVIDSNSLAQNDIFTRWKNATVNVPTIVPKVLDDTWTEENEVTISYDPTSTKREYRIINEDGESSEWMEYKEPLKIRENNVTIFARCEDESHTVSKESSYMIVNVGQNEDGILISDPAIKVGEYLFVDDLRHDSATVSIKNVESTGKIVETYFKLDDGEYKLSDTVGTYTFNNLKTDSTHTVKVYVKDEYGNTYGIYNKKITTLKLDKPIIKNDKSKNKWVGTRNVTIEYMDGNYTKEYTLDDGENWLPYEGEFVLDKPANIQARITDKDGAFTLSDVMDYSKTDGTAPIISKVTVSEKSSRIYIYATASDKESGIKYYEYSVDNENWYKSIYDNTFIKGLRHNTDYRVYVRAYNAGDVVSDTYVYETAKTKKLEAPTYSFEPSLDEWGYTKTVTITYPYVDEDTTQEYSLDLGETWLEYTEPVLIEEENKTIIARVTSGSNVVNASSFLITKIDRTEPTVSFDGLPKVIGQGEEYDIPTSWTVDNNKSGGNIVCKIGDDVVTNTKDLRVGMHNIICTVTTGAGHSKTFEHTLPVISSRTIEMESLVTGLQQNDYLDGEYNFVINGETYKAEYFNLGTTTFTEDQNLCDNVPDYKMCIIKVNGDLTIEEGVTVSPQVSKNGFYLYVSGTLTNKGHISMSRLGSTDEGQNVYLYKKADGNFEYVPKDGSDGALGIRNTSSNYHNGNNAGFALNRQTAGGGSGSSYASQSGNGGKGTSYSGGAGGGGAYASSYTNTVVNAVKAIGGTGIGSRSGGGTGAKAGTGVDHNGLKGAGGLLIIYADNFDNQNEISADGADANNINNTANGGASGGGSINIFTNNIINVGNMHSNGGKSSSVTGAGGTGGAGTVNISKIVEGQILGNDDNTIIVNNEEEYKDAINYIKYHTNAKVKINSDLDLTGVEYETISAAFNGTIDGDNHTISGLTNPLFNRLHNATIKNLTINSNVNSTNSTVGILANTITNSTIDNINLNGSITTTGNYVGSLAGKVNNSTIKNVTSNVNVSGNDYVGGLVGNIGSNTTLNSSTYNGTVTGRYYVGGAVGYTSGTEVQLTDIETTGIVSGEDTVGGVIGRSDVTSGKLTNLYSESQVTGKPHTAGIVGYLAFNSNNIEVNNLKSVGTVSGTIYVGGVIGELYNTERVDATISGLVSEGNVISTDNYVGGLIGYINTRNITNLTITDSYAENNVNGSSYVGGAVGYVNGTTSSTVVKLNKVYHTGNVVGSRSSIGGLVGFLRYGQLTNTFAIGNTSGNNYYGGLVGEADYSSIANSYALVAIGSNSSAGTRGGLVARSTSTTATNCYYSREIAKVFESALGVNIRLQNLLVSDNYNQYDFDNTWTIDEGESTAYFNGMKKPAAVNKSAIDYYSYEGSGTESNPYLIYTIDDINNIIYDYEGYYKFMNDVDVTGLTVANIGSDTYPFTGTIDGNGHKLIGLTKSSTSKYLGFINYATNATIKDLTLENVNISGSDFTGGLIGYSNGRATITNTNVSGRITGRNYIGGLVGYVNNANSNVTIKDNNVVNNLPSTRASYAYYGGLVGYINSSNANINLNNNNVNNSITTNGQYVGGLVGRIYANAGNLTINNNEVQGDFDSTSSYVGGLIGNISKNSSGEIQMDDNKVTGKFIGTSSNIGGLAGNISCYTSNLSIKNDQVISSEIRGSGSVGGFIGHLDSSSGKITVKDYELNNTITGTSSYTGGIFGYIYTSGPIEISNIKDTSKVTGSSYTGNIAGYLYTYNTATLSDIFLNGTTTGTSGYAGAIAGYIGSKNLNITKVESHNNVSGYDNVGGLIGKSDYSSNNTQFLSNSYSDGTVTGTSNYVGGLVGYANYLNINNAYSTNTVTGKDYVGGLVGYYQNATITNTYALGKVNGNVSNNVGGLIGSASNATFNSSYYSSEVSGVIRSAGGINLRTSYLIGKQGTYKNWDFDTIWTIEEDTTPYLLGLSKTNTITKEYLNIEDLQTNDDVYKIYTLEDLNNVRNELNAKYILMNDIILDERTNFTPIGENNYPFTGEFDGNGYTISGLNIVKNNLSYSGLFSHINGATIKNLVLSDITYNAKDSYMGAIAGYAGNNITLHNITVNYDINGGQYVGGLIGEVNAANSGTVDIDDITINGNVTSTSTYVGSLFGKLTLADKLKINNVKVNKQVKGNNYTGGLIGDINSTNNAGSIDITNVDILGNVVGSSYTGGLAGNVTTNSNITVDTFNNENGSITGGSYIGGMFGNFTSNNNASFDIENVNIDKTISGSQYTGGLLGYTNIKSTSTNTIKDVEVHGAVNATASYSGGLIGQINDTDSKVSTTTITGVALDNTVNSTSSYVGGLIGYQYYTQNDSLIINTTYTAGSVKGTEYVGGIFGYARNSSDSSIIEKSYSTSTITGTSYVGGIAGRDYKVAINNCFTVTPITSTSTYVGGLVGYLEHSSVTNSYAVDKVSVKTSNNTGGMIGLASMSTITDSYWSSETTGLVRTSGGINKRIRKFLVEDTYSNWDFDTVWAIDEGNTIAYLQDMIRPEATNKEYFKNNEISGDGTEVDTYKIYTLEDLDSVRYHLNAKYELMNDLDGEGKAFTAIGEANYPFKGEFNGNGYTIKNLTITSSTDFSTVNVGLFSNIESANIHDLNIKGFNVTGTDNVGILTGSVNKDSIIENVNVTESTLSGANNVGDLVGNITQDNARNTVIKNIVVNNTTTATGDNSSKLIGHITLSGTDERTLTIKEISVDGNLTATRGNNAGSIIGYLENTNSIANVMINNINVNSGVYNLKNNASLLVGNLNNAGNSDIRINEVAINANLNSTGTKVGGAVGNLENASRNVNISKTYVKSNITSTSNYVGGLVGYINNGEGDININLSFEDGNVTGSNYTAGLIGEATSTSEESIVITNSYASGVINGNNYVAGLVGDSKNVKYENTFSVGKVNGKDYVGGLIAKSNNDIVNNSYTTSKLTYTTINSGALIGVNTDSTITNTYYSLETANITRSQGGENYRINRLTNKLHAYKDWNFDTTWDVDTGISTAYIKDLDIPSYVYIENLEYHKLDGEGTEDEPYKIYTMDDFNGIRCELDAKYILMNDIDASGYNLNAIGEKGYPFTGVLDGKGFTISNITIDAVNEPILLGDYAGIFRIAKNATIKDINFENVIVKGSNYTGGLVGNATGKNTFNNINYQGTVSGTDNVGGLVGQLSSESNLKDVDVNTTITATNNVGGVVGNVNGTTNTFKNITSTTDITAKENVGGLIGTSKSNNNLEEITITPVYKTTTNNIGGIIGNLEGGVSIKHATVNESTLTATSYVGGIVGKAITNEDQFILDDIETTFNVTAESFVSSGIGYVENNSNEDITINGIKVHGAITATTNAGGLIANITNKQTGELNITNIISDVSITGVGESVNLGGLIGTLVNDSTGNVNINKVGATGNVSGADNVGGLIGFVNTTGDAVYKITYAYATGTVTGTADYTGGLIARYVGNDKSISTIGRSYATGDVFGINYVGGLVGYSENLVIEDTFATGKLLNANYTGSLIGAMKSTTVYRSYAIGSVNATLENVGALIGYAEDSDTINSYFSTTLSLLSSTQGGINVRFEKMLQEDTCYEGWDFDNVWTIDYGKSTAYITGLPRPDSVDIENIDYQPTEGSGTVEDPYLIDSYIDLISIGIDLEAHYKMTGDVVVPDDLPIYPIGDIEHPFKGTFEGDGHTISQWTKTTTLSNIGIFAATEGATIENVNISNSNIKQTKSTSKNVAGLVGLDKGGSTFRNISVTGSISNKGENTGSLVGETKGGSTFENMYLNTTMIAGEYAGALVGTSQNSVIKDILINGTIVADDYAGSIAGFDDASSIYTTYTVGKVFTNSTKNYGMFGAYTATGAVNTYYFPYHNGYTSSTRGTAINNGDIHKQSSYEGFDFTNVWKLNSHGMPILRRYESMENDIDLNELEYNFDYNGSYREFTIPKTGIYNIELWGAEGGNNGYAGGRGGYASGKVKLVKGKKIYIYVGESGNSQKDHAAFNGGGLLPNAFGGGGATDVRLTADDLLTRFIVAGGGGSSIVDNGEAHPYENMTTGLPGGPTSTLIYKDDKNVQTTFGATQTSGNALGVGADGIYNASAAYYTDCGNPKYGSLTNGAGGGGFYGGQAPHGRYYYYNSGRTYVGGGRYSYYCYHTEYDYSLPGTGGSSYALTADSAKPEGYKVPSKYNMTDVSLIAGDAANLPARSGLVDAPANRNNGYARITLVEELPDVNAELLNGDINTIGSVVEIGGEDFYIIGKGTGNDADKTMLLTKYNLSNNNQVASNPERVQFSTSKYWGDQETGYIYNENSNLYSIVNAYVNKVEGEGISSVTGRILSREEALSLPTSIRGNGFKYWVGTPLARDTYRVWVVGPDGSLADTKTLSNYDNFYEYNCVRPVILIPTNQIDY